MHSNENLNQNSFHSNPRKVCHEWNIDEMWVFEQKRDDKQYVKKKSKTFGSSTSVLDISEMCLGIGIIRYFGK